MDTLTIEIHRHLDEKLDIKDYYTGEDYLVDEKTGEPFSAGPDGEPGTEDDIRLGEWR